MKLTALGKITILIIVIGLAFGGYRLWKQSGPGKTVASGPNVTQNGKTNTPSASTPVEDSKPVEDTGNTSGGVEIPFVITAAKKDWVTQQVAAFNAANAGKYIIVPKPIPSREAMHAILAGKEKPTMWSPGSPIWPIALGQAWKKEHPKDATIVDLNNPKQYRVFLRTPLVFMTTKTKAKFLRPLLSSPQAWANLRALSMGVKRSPFGPLKFSHADPLTSSSGMLTLGLILSEYGKSTGQSGDLNALATNPKFLKYVSELERGLVYDAPAEKGTTALTNAFLEDLNVDHYDMITGYESAALAAAKSHPNLAVIYPSPSAVSEHGVVVLGGSWVSEQQRKGAEEFVQFLGSEQAIRDGVKTYFRPAARGSEINLNRELASYKGQGFEQTFSDIELPPYEALNDAAYQWRVKIAKQAP